MMLGLCALTIQLLMRLNADGQARLSAAVALERLARQLRDDAHASEAAQLAADAKAAGEARQPAADHRARSYASPTSSRRRASSGIESRPARRSGTSRTRCRPAAVARFELRDEAAHRLVALVVTQVAGKSRTDPPRPLEVVALPGKDRLGPLGNREAKHR